MDAVGRVGFEAYWQPVVGVRVSPLRLRLDSQFMVQESKILEIMPVKPEKVGWNGSPQGQP